MQSETTPRPLSFGTFGTYRFVLALMVALSHFGAKQFSFYGDYAVLGFFILSGYVVSYILSQSYLHMRHGLWKYAANRALRIYPAYWAVLILMLVLLRFDPQGAERLKSLFAYPRNWALWFFDITLISILNPFLSFAYQMVIPVSWSLYNEIVCWALMPKILTSRIARAALFILALAYTFWVIWLHYSQPRQELIIVQYIALPAALLPFMAGMYLFRQKALGLAAMPHRTGIAALILMALLIVGLVFRQGAEAFGINFYIALVFSMAIVGYLSRFDERAIPPLLQRIDRFLGSLAYPLYLLHFPALFVVYNHVQRIAFGSAAFVGYALALSLAASLALHYAVEVPVNRLRRLVKA